MNSIFKTSIPISKMLIKAYVGTISVWWIAKKGITPDPDDYPMTPEFFEEEVALAQQRSEKTILELGVRKLLASRDTSFSQYNESEAEWTDEEMSHLLEALLA